MPVARPRGVDAGLGLRPFHGFRPMCRPKYLHAIIGNHEQAGDDALRTVSTFTNDQAMPGFVSSEMAFGYRLHPLRGVKPELRLNLINVGDNK